MRESAYQNALIDRIKCRFPGCIVIKNDPSYQQGFPDLLVLYKDSWAALEVKASKRSAVRPNQDYWIDRMDEMSFAAFVYPENEDEVLDDLEYTLSVCR